MKNKIFNFAHHYYIIKTIIKTLKGSYIECKHKTKKLNNIFNTPRNKLNKKLSYRKRIYLNNKKQHNSLFV